jgi:hypothetical protein
MPNDNIRKGIVVERRINFNKGEPFGEVRLQYAGGEISEWFPVARKPGDFMPELKDRIDVMEVPSDLKVPEQGE